jgi:GH15 family glucan-1,4-alpha-glucosidase
LRGTCEGNDRGVNEAADARTDGFAPIRSYAAIGDGRTVALVARDGSIDWLAVPALDGVPLFGALLDVERGGSFTLAPVDDHEVTRRYVGRSNVLETTFTTADGVARVVDGLMLQDGGELSWVELLRRVEGVAGSVRFRYRLRPRFGFDDEPRFERRGEALLACSGERVLALRSFDAGDAHVTDGAIEGELAVDGDRVALLSCVVVGAEPIPLPTREEHEIRLRRTVDAWERWAAFMSYDGPQRDAVERSALALKLLISSSTGAVAAAPTTSLPERVGGDQNWDYRFAWVRDSALTLDALGSLGYREQVHASLAWLLRATEPTHPRLAPFYTLAGDSPGGCTELDLTGYRGSRPVRDGNGASGQLQLGVFGDLLETIWLYVRHGNALDERTGRRVAEIADHVCGVWQQPNSGIWELHDEQRYTQATINCWLALDRAVRLADAGEVPAARRSAWHEERERIRRWVDDNCWSDAKQSYTLHDGTERLDAAVLLAARCGFLENGHPRLASTIDAIRSELGAGGPLLYRYSGRADREGAFLACSFWLVSALVTCDRTAEASALFDELVALANDVGLLAEEIDADTGAFLGNFPQGLTHLALINAAVAIAGAA